MRVSLLGCCLSTAILGGTLPTASTAQTSAAEQQPLSVIDWLGTQAPAARPAAPAPRAAPLDEPPVAQTGAAPKVTTAPLGGGSPRQIGLVPPGVTGMPTDIWVGSDVDVLNKRIAALPELHLPAAQSLLYTILLTEAQAPQKDAAAGDTLALQRVEKLVALGALDPALSLIEQAGVTMSPDHFDLWMRISLLAGTEDRACAVLRNAPHLTRDYGVRILCAARDGNWENAALTYGSAQALKLLPAEKLDLLDRFLNPDLFEDAAPLPAPRAMDPLSFRMFETIGERKATRTLPLAYSVADLRDVAGWKAQIEAAERLTRGGALPDNHLLGLYTDRKPAASGSIWDRVAAFQRFETALGSGSADAVAKTLPQVWSAMQDGDLETAFAGLFAERLSEFALEGRAARTAFDIGLLSPAYETIAASGPNDPDTALLRAVALGEASTARPQDPLAAAIHDAFGNAAPDADLVKMAQEKRLGEAVLTLLNMLEDGIEGDPNVMRDALATLRALGLEDTARRAALQVLLLEADAQ